MVLIVFIIIDDCNIGVKLDFHEYLNHSLIVIQTNEMKIIKKFPIVFNNNKIMLF